MTPADRLINIFAKLLPHFQIVWLFKFLFLVGLVIYSAFAFIIIRQVNLMNKTLEVQFGLPLKLIAWVHFIVAIVIFIIAIMIL